MSCVDKKDANRISASKLGRNPAQRIRPESEEIPTTAQFSAKPETKRWWEFLSWSKGAKPIFRSTSDDARRWVPAGGLRDSNQPAHRLSIFELSTVKVKNHTKKISETQRVIFINVILAFTDVSI